VFHRIDLKTGALSESGVLAAFRESDDVTDQGFMPVVRLQIPIDTATGKRATVDTPPDRIEIIEIDPKDVGQYLGEGAG
jgi:hypothetical protein